MTKFYTGKPAKALLITVITLFAFAMRGSAQSEYYHAFKTDFGFSYGSNTASVTVEPHYRITDLQAVGLRYQFAVPNTDNANSAIAYESYCTTFEQYFASEKSYGDARFFGGVGLGAFTYDDTRNKITKTSFGYFPKLGFEASHFRTSVEYNFTGNSFNYLQVSLGFFLGGGKK